MAATSSQHWPDRGLADVHQAAMTVRVTSLCLCHSASGTNPLCKNVPLFRDYVQKICEIFCV